MPQPVPASPPRSLAKRVRQCAKKSLAAVIHHVKTHVGVGVVCAVAYFDPYVIFAPRHGPSSEVSCFPEEIGA